MIQVYRSSEIVQSLRIAETLRGVLPIRAAGWCETGTGRLRTNATGTHIEWRAPGDSAYGAAVAISADGQYLLRSDDADKWLLIQVWREWVLTNHAEANVYLADWHNGIIDDIDAATASAGGTVTDTLRLVNDSPSIADDVVVWLDNDDYLEISADEITWVAPTSEATGLAMGDIAGLGDVDLFVRRVIGASTDAEPKILDIVKLTYTGDS